MAILGFCPKCGSKAFPWFDTCKKCGEKLPGPKSPAIVDYTEDTKAPRRVVDFEYCPYCGAERNDNAKWFDSCRNCGALFRVFPNDRYSSHESRNYEHPRSTYGNTRDLHIPSQSEFIAEVNDLRRRLLRSMSGSATNNFLAVKDIFPDVLQSSEWPMYMGGEELRKVDCWDLFREPLKIILDGVENNLSSMNDFSDAKRILSKIIESDIFDEDNIIRAMKLLNDINEAVVRKERSGVEEYQELYSTYKSKCCKCGGTPEPGLVSLCQMHGLEGRDGEHWLIEFDLPVCRSCENRRRALLNEVYAKRAEAQAQYEKKKKLMDFIVFGRDKVLREAYEPVRATYAEEDRYSLDNYYKDFPVIAKLLSKRYSFGGRYDTGIRGRGDFSRKPENEMRLV